jgi:hypothetical protein
MQATAVALFAPGVFRAGAVFPILEMFAGQQVTQCQAGGG